MKNAGSSFEMAFAKYCGPHDIITPIAINKTVNQRKRAGYNKGQNYTAPYEYKLKHRRTILMDPSRFTEHYSAKKIQQSIPEQVWNSYLKVAIIRSPYDMLISYYYWLKRLPKNEIKDFENYALERGIKWLIRNYRKLQIDKKLVINFMIRYENLNEDIKKLEMKIGCYGVLESFTNLHAKGDFRPKTENTSVHKIYSEHPKVKIKTDKALHENFGRDELQKYFSAYKSGLEKAIDEYIDTGIISFLHKYIR